MEKKRKGLLKLITVIICSLITFTNVSTIFAYSPGEITTANQIFVINKKSHTNNIQATNDLFSVSIQLTSPGTSTINGDMYRPVYTFTKKANSNYRLLNVISYIDDPSYTITTNLGSTEVAKGSYLWDDTIQAWRIPNPMYDLSGNPVDTTTAVNGTEGIKLYITGDSTGILPLNQLTNDNTKSGSRPVIYFGDVANMSVNTPQVTEFNLFQERTYSGAEDKWHALNYFARAFVEYEFDATVTGTNPYNQAISVGDGAHFESQINLDAPAKFTSDFVWQVSTDNGTTYTDIDETAQNSNGSKNTDMILDFTPNLSDDGNLYRVKITPNESTGESIYTEPALLTFNKATTTFTLNKSLSGKTLTDKQFEFVLKTDDGSTVIETVKNNTEGKINFSPLNYYEVGTYKYTVQETNDNQEGITYDTMNAEINVNVVKNEDGTLTATVIYPEDIEFNNSYTEKSKPDDKPKDTSDRTNSNDTKKESTTLPKTGEDPSRDVELGFTLLAASLLYFLVKFRKLNQ